MAFSRGAASDAKRAARDDVKRYLAGLWPGIAGSSQARRLSALRQFFGFLYAEGIRADDPTNAVEFPKRGRTLPKILSREDMELLSEAAAKRADESEEGVRLNCIVEMLYGSGLRVSELATLPLAAVRDRDNVRAGERQGRQGAPGAAESAGARRRSPIISWCARCSCRAANGAAMRRNSCFPRARRNAI